MARKEDKQPQYLPLIVKAKLHTGGRDYEKIKEELKGQGFTCKQNFNTSNVTIQPAVSVDV